MSLADCIQKLNLDPELAAKVTARSAELQASGVDQDTAEEQAAQELVDEVEADIEDVRSQLGIDQGAVDIEMDGLPTDDESIGKIMDDVVYDQPIGARVPTGKNRTEDPLTEPLVAELEVLARKPALVAKAREKLEPLNSIPPVEGESDQEFVDRFVRHVAERLLALHDAVPADVRERSRKWYDGASKIADDWAKKYGLEKRAVAGVLAVLSPQKDWYQNVDLGRRVLDIVTSESGRTWEDSMLENGLPKILESATNSLKSGKTDAIESLVADWKKDPANKRKRVTDTLKKSLWDEYVYTSLTAIENDFRALAGREWSSLSEVEKGRFIRLKDVATNEPTYPIVTPEGEFGDIVRKKDGKPSKSGKPGKRGQPAKVVWAGYANIGKAAAIIEDQSIETISRAIGNEHKVRNFYNNIFDPNNPAGFVTIDTHAVAAGLLRPLAGSDTAVVDNFGAFSDADSGISGTYAIYATAYRAAAEARGILPREMQSITWEAVRGLFTARFKSKENKKAVKDIWDKYAKGEMTHDEAIAATSDLAGGILPPTWYGTGSDTGGDEAAEAADNRDDVQGKGWPLGRRGVDGPDGRSVRMGDFSPELDLAEALSKPGWTVITGTVEKVGPYEDPENVRRREALKQELTEKGIEFIETTGVYDGVEQGVSLLALTDDKTANELGIKYLQDSVLTNKGLEYADGSLVPQTGLIVGEDAKKEQFYSVLPDGRAFSFKLDFAAKRPRELNQPSTKVPRTIKEAVEAGKPFDLIHWSRVSGLKSLDPNYAGTAGAGAEKAAYAKGARKRTHLGLLGRYQLEPAVGAAATTAYRVTVKPAEVYDLTTDPRSFIRGAKTLQAGLDKARKAGFKYFYSSKEGPWGPFLFTNDKVTGLKEIPAKERAKLVRPPMPKPTAQEEQDYLYGQPAVVEIDEAELGTTFDSRREFYQSAYHGTGNTDPYPGGVLRFDKVNARGGEGTQMEGWGVYVTQSKEAGAFYREQNRIGQDKWSYQGKDASEFPNGGWLGNRDVLIGHILSTAKEQSRPFEGPESATRLVRNTISDMQKNLLARNAKDVAKGDTRQVDERNKILEDLQSLELLDFERTTAEGRLYQVSIPDDTGGNYLDLNLSIEEQSDQIKAALSAAIAAAGGPKSWVENNDKSSGMDAYRDIVSLLSNGRRLREAQRAASELLRKHGIVGNKYRGDEGKGDYLNFVIFEDVPYTAFEQAGEEKRRGSVQIVSDGYIIRLTNEADLSTILHETGHIFLEELHSIIVSGMASQETTEDYNTLMEYLGNDGEAITRDQHEKFASSFEAYLLRGKSPNAKLREAFGTFRRWLTNIYERVVRGDALAGIEKNSGFKLRMDDKVIEVFDRLLTQKMDVGAAAASGQMLDYYEPDDAKGDEDDEVKAKRLRVNQLVDDARRKVEENLFTRRALIVSSNYKQWEADATAAVRQAPVYRAIEELKLNKLDRATVVQNYGQEAADVLEKRKLLTDNGQLPDAAATIYSFPDGAALVGALATAPSMRRAINAAIKARVDEAWSSYSTADAIAETPEYARAMTAAEEYFAQILGRKPVGSQQLKDEARDQLGAMPLRQAMQVDRHLQVMQRHQRAERVAFAAGDFETALVKARAGRKALEMARFARKLKDKVESIQDRVSRMKEVKLGSVEFNYHINALVIAVRHGLLSPDVLAIPGANRVPSLRALMAAAMDPDSALYEPSLDAITGFSDEMIDGTLRDDKGQPIPWHGLTIDQLAEADNLMRFLLAKGKSIVDGKILDGQITLEQAAQKLLSNLVKLEDKKVFEEGTMAARAMRWVDGYVASLTNWQFLTRRMGNTVSADGDPEKLLFDPLHKASGERQKLFIRMQKRLEPAMKHFGSRLRDMPKYIDVRVAPSADMVKAGRTGFTFENVIVAALNMGNDYNRSALAQGFGWDEAQAEINLAELTKVLTAKDWEAVQDVLNGINELYPMLAEVFERRNGFPLAKVEAKPFTVKTADGKTMTLAGGYYPVKFDTTLSDRAAAQSEAEDLKNAAGAAFPTVGTKSGMTKQRSSTGGKPLSMTLGSLSQHVRDTVQYITFSEVVVDVYRMLKHPAVQAGFIQKFGRDQFRAVRKMLADIGMPEPGGIDMWDRALNSMRAAATAWALGANLGTAVKQTQAFFNFASDEGWTTIASGYKAMASMGLGESVAQMRQLSSFMDERWVSADRELADAMKSVSWLHKPKLEKVQQAMFLPIQAMDRATVIPMWWGSYTKALKTMAHADAVLAADKAISFTVPGAPRPLDQNALLRDKRGWVRLLTSFSTATFHFANRQMFYHQAWRAGNVSTGQYAYKVLTEGVMSPLAMIGFFSLMYGNWPPDEEQVKGYAFDVLAFQVSGFPIVREIVNAASRHQRFGESIPSFSGLDMAIRSGRGLYDLAADMASGEEARAQRALWAFADMVSFVYKIPASKVAERISEGWRQVEEFENDDAALEWLNDTFTILIPDPEKRGK